MTQQGYLHTRIGTYLKVSWGEVGRGEAGRGVGRRQTCLEGFVLPSRYQLKNELMKEKLVWYMSLNEALQFYLILVDFCFHFRFVGILRNVIFSVVYNTGLYFRPIKSLFSSGFARYLHILSPCQLSVARFSKPVGNRSQFFGFLYLGLHFAEDLLSAI